MKKIYNLFPLLCLLAGMVGPPDSAHGQCDVVITGDFDSECVFDFKDDVTDEYPSLMVACEGSTVVYTAFSNSSATVLGYLWEVQGDVSHSASGNQLTVTWGTTPWGLVVANVIYSGGDTCTGYSRVKIVESPVASATTIPAYTVNPSGDKVITVCKGESVTFIDQSVAGGGDIAGCNWESSTSSSTNPVFTIDNILASDVVKHRVYNNCGCSDEERIIIKLENGVPLELDCYGTACEGSSVTYHALSPVCTTYQWYVDGGTVTAGQGTSSPTVLWDSPHEGYGILGLDGNLCGNQACPAMMSRRIPVIHGDISIDGPADMCVGEAALYTLPLFGSTKYTWSVTPSTGVNTVMLNHTNTARLVFEQPGTYQVRCSYRCDFLDCGPYKSEPLTVTVKPAFAVNGDSLICVANACSLYTVPPVNAVWTVRDLASGSQTAPSSPSSTFTASFGHAGRYLVMAEEPAHCGPATFLVNVRDVPPAPTVDDLDPDNPHSACIGSGAVLRGAPSSPGYSLVWSPACSTATPQQFFGDSVSINYPDAVCDVRVYNYDRMLHCLSTGYYLHTMTALTPAPLNIPPVVTVCPGSMIVWGDNEIPNQSGDGMLYEWKIDENKQYCASVQGNHQSNGIVLSVNEVDTTTFRIMLKRTYCDNWVKRDTIHIRVRGQYTNQLSISGPDTVCVNSAATYTGSGGDQSSYVWYLDGSSSSGISATHTFSREGLRKVTLSSNPYDYCTNGSYLHIKEKNIFVCPQPMVQGVVYDPSTTTLCVVPALNPADYSFQWTCSTGPLDPPFTLGTGACETPSVVGSYACTVTENATGCSKTVSYFYDGGLPGGCNGMSFTGSYNHCTHTLSLSAGQYQNIVNWSVRGGNHSMSVSGYHDCHADISFDNIGIYSVKATSSYGPLCYEATWVQTVDFIPEFNFTPGCTMVGISNHSRYALPGGTVYMEVSNNCNSTVDPITIPVGLDTFTYIPSVPPSGLCTYTFTLSGYGVYGNISCELGSVTIGHAPVNQGMQAVSLTLNNQQSPANTCDNTPARLEATLNTSSSIARVVWSFGDYSVFTTSGNSVYHTFKKDITQYYVNAEIIDNYGCDYNTSAPFSVTSNQDNLANGTLSVLSSTICPNTSTSRNLSFSIYDPTYDYYWYRPHSSVPTHNHSALFSTYYAGNYKVYVENAYFCKKEAMKYVDFHPSPIAYIYAESLNCCTGRGITLYGDQGPNAALSYSWSVSGPSGFSLSAQSPDLSFVPPNAGAYSVTLTVSNSYGCSSTATETVNANASPTAPSLSISGSPCISDAPVQITATGYSGEMHWSNGATGPSANYYTPGVATAFYFDPAIGCPSDTARIKIEHEPDFAALLTGCYDRCKSQVNTLPVYALAADSQTVNWKWTLNSTPLDSGHYSLSALPLLLPLGVGDHYLTVSSPGALCGKTSPVLSITNDGPCICDSVTVTVKSVETEVIDCKLQYYVIITVCNNATARLFCIDKLLVANNTANVSVSYENVTGGLVNPNDCEVFEIKFVASALIPRTVMFELSDAECSDCVKRFVVDLMPSISCVNDMTVEISSVDPSLSSQVAGYYSFSATVGPVDKVLAFWSEPPMVVNYLYDGISDILGLGMADMGLLSQLAAEDSVVCFHAITCHNDILCLWNCCIGAAELYDMILETLHPSKSGLGASDGVSGTVEPLRGEPGLKPNPTNGEVRVVGTADEVTEVLVMDMAGRAMATFGADGAPLHDGAFSVADLAPGMYIARVKTRRNGHTPERVAYLKLVKK